jgi:hypothetical protein
VVLKEKNKMQKFTNPSTILSRKRAKTRLVHINTTHQRSYLFIIQSERKKKKENRGGDGSFVECWRQLGAIVAGVLS